jgi:1-acyl-sn-glycerol-3-phosphate acyltransferase
VTGVAKGRGPIAPISRAGRVSYRVLRWIGVFLLSLVWRVRVEGRDRLPIGVPYVVAPVHRSYVDFLVVAVGVPRVMRFMVKDSIWKWAWLGRFIEWNGSFPVDREHADRDALRRCEESVAGGDPVVMFPEGRRKDGDTVEDLFDGPSFVACRNRVPLVPIGIGGSQEAMPIGKKMIRLARITVVIGEPIYPDVPLTGRVPRRMVTENTEQLREAVQHAYDQARTAAAART